MEEIKEHEQEFGDACKLAPCIVCNQLSKLQCSKCYVVFYCGPTCQRSDWGIHRVICASYNKIVSLKIPPKPSKGKSLLVYFFPEDKKAAKLAWVEHFNFPS